MIGTPVAPVFVDGVVPSGVIDGVNVTFTLPDIPATGSLHLYDPLRLTNGIGYTLSGLTITFTVAPSVGAELSADYRR